jgi:hypothetical protein
VSNRLLLVVLLVFAGCVLAQRDGEPPPRGEAPAPDATAAAPAPPAPVDHCPAPADCYGPAQRVGSYDVAAVPEASGLAASVRNPGVYYLLDDGRTSRVWVLRPEEGLLGAVGVSGLEGRDTEDLAVGACGAGDPATCVYVGDIGDNGRRREQVRVHRFVEPDLSAGVPDSVGADSVALRYPDGPTDAEALLVDADGVPLVIAKASFDEDSGVTGPTRVYRAPGWAGGTMTDLGELPLPPPRLGLAEGVVGHVVTGADARPGRVLVRTYDAVFEYEAAEDAAPLATFPAWPVAESPSGRQRQSEAVAYRADGCGYLAVAEDDPAIWGVACDP